MTEKQMPSIATFILFPAIAMLLGWGLRGYIGGGPYGAMIPGCFVALSICLLLGYKVETAAMAAVFGAMGIGLGGEMTYGQTLGFLRDPETLSWGVLGCTVKGGTWGLLGGTLLGLGLNRDTYSRKTIILGLLIMVEAFVLGREFINEPKLIYFSNLADRPRDESWAGLLVSALALLAFLRYKGSAGEFRVPLRFAIFGCAGGAIGFGVGCLFLAYGPSIQWIGWWKMMEFFFGLAFGAALGLCAYTLRDTLVISGQEGEVPPRTWSPVFGLVAVIVSVFATYLLLDTVVSEEFMKSEAMTPWLIRKTVGVFLSFSFVAAIVIICGLFSQHAAWQAAIALTFFHTVFDYTQDLDNISNFGFVLSTPVQWLINIGATVLIGFCAFRLQKGARPVSRLLLLVVWFCFATACARSFIDLQFFDSADGQSYLSALITAHPSIIFVQGTFIVSAIITTRYALRLAKTA